MGTKRQIVEFAGALLRDVLGRVPLLLGKGEAEKIGPLCDDCLRVASVFYGRTRAFGARDERKARRIYTRPKQSGAGKDSSAPVESL